MPISILVMQKRAAEPYPIKQWVSYAMLRSIASMNFATWRISDSRRILGILSQSDHDPFHLSSWRDYWHVGSTRNPYVEVGIIRVISKFHPTLKSGINTELCNPCICMSDFPGQGTAVCACVCVCVCA